MIPKKRHSQWPIIQWLLKWSLILFAISGSLFMVHTWLVMQESDIACKAKAYDQLEKIINMVKKAQS